jgi:uncharacterized membrane protein YphA (DoxX/SURF4 family)
MHDLIRSLDRLRPAALLILRVGLGAIFLLHGLDKFDAGIENIEAMFTMWGVPAPGLAAPLVAILEIIGGAALIAGIGTRLAAGVLSLVLIGAIFYVKADLGVISTEPMPGAEVDLALLAGLIAVLVIGPGSLSADAAVGIEPGDALERVPVAA